MAIAEAREATRQEAANDAKFYRSFIYFFELRVPAEAYPAVAGEGLLFPLMLNPEMITLSEPFAVQETPTADGGLFVEENGIIRRTLRIAGSTGWKPRNLAMSPALTVIRLENPSFKRRGTWTPFALSGHAHFKFLQDTVFRTYGDLKRNPATALDTQLIFHNPKDDEHWLVVPKEFRLDRDARAPLTYRYSIDLLIVDKAEDRELRLSSDKGLLDSIKDVISTVRGYLDLAISAVKDVTKFVNELTSIVHDIGATLDKVSGFLNSVSDFISGVGDFIAAPFKMIGTIVSDLDKAITKLAAAPFAAANSVIASFRRMQDAFDGFGTHPEVFETEVRKFLRNVRGQGELTTSTTQRSLKKAAATPATTLRGLQAQGTKSTAGDLDRANGEFGVGRNEPTFHSAAEYEVADGDTLSSIAAQRLGDARLWRQIAALNRLRAPYISRSGLPGTKRPGDKILVPSRAPAPENEAGASIIGARPTEDIADRLLGRDLMLVPSAVDPKKYTVAIDTSGGSTDARTISGVDNLAQALKFRLSVEQGTDLLYKNIGYRRVVGLNIPIVDAESLRLRLSEAVIADPRISTVGAVKISESSSADAIEVELDAAVRGFNDPVTVTAAGPVAA